MQKQVADLLKVSVDNIRNWEANRGKVSLQFLPKVYDFIGFCPCDVFLPVGLRLRERREYFGLTIKSLSYLLSVDSCTIAYWERGEHQPNQISLRIIENFLLTYLPIKENLQEVKIFIQGNPFLLSKIPNYVVYESKWSIGKKMTAWRMSAGLSQRQLAKLSGISFQSICKWENGLRVPNSNYQNRIFKTITEYLILLKEVK